LIDDHLLEKLWLYCTLPPASERDSFSEVVLVERLREAIRRLNPANACGNPHPASPTGRGGAGND
jgi:hypothetical protein